jgi:antitoxin component YwqK of YwqJK toxin-antitoxin module
MREVTFKDGILDGKLLEWNQQRELVRNDFFREGRKIVRNVTFYRPKQMQSENYYLDGKLVLAGEDNWWDAKPAAIDRVGERVQHGPANLWFDNGLPKMRGQYVEGKRVGRFIWWHSNGNKQLEGGYVKGNKTGLWVWRHKNGMKAIEGSYEDDIAAGIWKWWDAEGNVKAEEDMDENQQAEEEDAKKEALNSILDSGSSEETSGSNEETPDVLPTGDSSQPTDSSKDEAADPYAGFEDISPIESENDEPATSKPANSDPANSDPANSDPANSEPAGSESAEDDSKEAEGSEGDFDTLKEYFSSRTDDT